MLKVNYYYTIKTLLEQGYNISEISRKISIDRKTVRKIKNKIENGSAIKQDGSFKIPRIKRKSILDPYNDEIKNLLNQGYSAVLVHKYLNEQHQKKFAYSTVRHYVSKLKPKESYIPIITPPGEEAQVDFGDIGYLNVDGKKKKAYVFCMVLCHSRYAYYEIVLNQKVQTFINCHINAFEYFGGVPKVVRIDNLKAGVLKANFYEASLQTEYAAFLRHYKSSGITCRIRRGQDKGKVEAGIKYVKNNFIKGLRTDNISKAKTELRYWVNETANNRIHGTTKKIPSEEFQKYEKNLLLELPQKRFEFFTIEKRTVNNYSHISYKNNYYSVPYKYRLEEVHVKSNASIIKIFNKYYDEIAVHTIEKGSGEYITNKNHINPYKKRMNEIQYAEKALSLGEMIHAYFEILKEKYPIQYHRMINGIFKLTENYSNEIVNMACKRALDYELYGYIPVKRICENGLYKSAVKKDTSVIAGGYNHELKIYDDLINGGNYD